MIFTNAAAKRDFYLIHFGVKTFSAQRHTQRQDVLVVKIVASSCPASVLLSVWRKSRFHGLTPQCNFSTANIALSFVIMF